MARYFFDTNIIVYSLDPADPTKQRHSLSVLEATVKEGSGLISSQVVQECLHLILRKFQQRGRAGDVGAFLNNVLMPLCKIFPSGALFENALSITAETGWTFYDSLIVSAAIEGNCEVLYTEDLQHGRVIRGVKIQNPFA